MHPAPRHWHHSSIKPSTTPTTPRKPAPSLHASYKTRRTRPPVMSLCQPEQQLLSVGGAATVRRSHSYCQTEAQLRLHVSDSAATAACIATLYISCHKTVLLGGTNDKRSSPPRLMLPPSPLPARKLVPVGTVQEKLRRLCQRAAAAEERCFSRATPGRRSLTFADRRRFWSRRSEGMKGAPRDVDGAQVGWGGCKGGATRRRWRAGRLGRV